MKSLPIIIYLVIAVTLGFSDTTSNTTLERSKFKQNMVVPRPSEVITALDNMSKVKWKDVVKYNYRASYNENHMIALNLGIRIADGFIAIQSQDKINIGKMFSISQDLAGNFGAKSGFLPGKSEIQKLVSLKKWFELRLQLDNVHRDFQKEITKYHPDFVTMVVLGGWLEGLHVVSRAILLDYEEKKSTLLYQPELVSSFIDKLKKMDDVNSNNAMIKKIKEGLITIKSLVDVNYGVPISKENVNKLHKISASLVNDIEKGE